MNGTTHPGDDDRLVAYSLVLPSDGSRDDLIWQFAGSVSTLRWHNSEMAVVLNVHGALPDDLRRICAAHRVTLRDLGPYEDRLAALCPTGWPALARNPLLHRFLGLADLAAIGPRQVMLCDCDTIFFRDVTELFDRYAAPDVVAREELLDGHAGPALVQALLAELAEHEGVAAVPPFNVGVVLLNNHLCVSLGELQTQFVDYAWRFVVGLVADDAVDGADGAEPAGLPGLVEARLHATDGDVSRALRYPAADGWLLDQVAWWMTLGHLPGLRVGGFAPADVAEHGELRDVVAGTDPWVMCRYDTPHVAQIAAWLAAHELTPTL